MSSNILIVEKLGTIKTLYVKNITENDLYKKAGFKTNDGFKCHTNWNVEINNTSYSIYVYGKTVGRANQENKYEFPPPIDKVLFFGNCIIVNKIKDKIGNISLKEWEEIYEKLYGGFEDIGDEDSEDDSDIEDDDDENLANRTKSGYLKDDFVVDDDDDDDFEEEDDDEIDEEEDEDNEEDNEFFSKKRKVIKKPSKKSKKKTAKIISVQNNIEKDEEEIFLDCKSELSEESYIEE